MNVPLLDLGIQHEALHKEILDAIERVLRSSSFILGPEVASFEKNIARYCRTKAGVGVSSGSDALTVALMALGIGPGDEVITAPYSFFATAGAIARVGARPVFVDVDPDSYNIDPEGIEPAINDRTKAIVPVHLFGQCAEMDPILNVAKGHDLSVIEDAAQAIGADYRNGRRAGGMGTVGCLSFFPSKNLGAMGDAGMVVTNDTDLAEKIRILRVHGGKPKYHHDVLGGNFRLDALQAAILNVKLPHLDTWTKRRQEHAKVYESELRKDGFCEQASLRLPEAVFSKAALEHHHIFNQFVIRAPRRNRLREHLTKKNIRTEVYYPIPLHLQKCFQYLGYKEGDFPVAERAADETLALPVYPELTREQQTFVVESIREYYLSSGNAQSSF